MRLTKLSYSRMSCFLQCNLQYRFKYHDKLESLEPTPDYFEFGNFIHRLFELYAKDGITIQEAFTKAFEEYNKFGNKHKACIREIVSNFLKFDNKLKKSDFVSQEFEEGFSLKFPNIETQMTGFIDRKLKLPDDKFIIVDYKTSKSELSKQEAMSNHQLMTYSWVCSVNYDIDPKNILAGLFYARTGNSVFVSFDQKQINKFVSFCEKTCETIHEMQPDNAKPNRNEYCYFCDYKSICPDFNKGK
ncbi:MAG: RecB family exonuclease [Bacillota bacterium]